MLAKGKIDEMNYLPNPIELDLVEYDRLGCAEALIELDDTLTDPSPPFVFIELGTELRCGLDVALEPDSDLLVADARFK